MIDCMEKSQLQLINVATSSTASNHPAGQPPSYLSSMYPNSNPIVDLIQQTAVPVSNQQQPQQNGNELIGYYFGSISRETAEWILKTHGDQMDGAYLLRSSGPNDDFVLSLMVLNSNGSNNNNNGAAATTAAQDVLHYKIVETEDSFVALHGQVGDEKFATIDELIDKAQGVATKPRWPILRQTLECQILPPTYWGLTVDQIRLAILIKARQWGFPLLASLLPAQTSQSLANEANLPLQQPALPANDTTTLNNETIRTLIYKSLHEFQPWFHGKISREEAERRIEEGPMRDGRFLVRERDNYSYAMCISHKKTTKHYRIDVLPTGELAIQDGRKFTSLMALVSHYTIMSDGLWCALTDACVRPISQQHQQLNQTKLDNNRPPMALNGSSQYMNQQQQQKQQQGLYSGVPPTTTAVAAVVHSMQSSNNLLHNMILPPPVSNGPINQLAAGADIRQLDNNGSNERSLLPTSINQQQQQQHHLSVATSIKGPIREWLQSINHKWSQLMASKSHQSSMNSFLFGNQNPLNNHQHCRRNRHHHHSRTSGSSSSQSRRCKNGHTSCGCIKQMMMAQQQQQQQQQAGARPLQLASYRLPQQQVNSACCAALPTPMAQNGVAANMLPPVANANGFVSSLLVQPTQNSGFTLNSQSFIGSPLFAVAGRNQQPAQQQQQQVVGSTSARPRSVSNSASSSAGSSQTSAAMQQAGGHAEEGKLISPVQSISGELSQQQAATNPYQTNLDIYGSVAASTAIINDRREQLTSTSSSSGQGAHCNNNNVPMHVANSGKVFMSMVQSHQQPPVQYAGPILCGQHAGPAYRYTNCGGDENSFRQCLHNQPPQQQQQRQAPIQQPIVTYNRRAADDSQLFQGATQLVGPAAMSKFVQFQDGQCLRTHRDTKSIQMAYLSSRQQQSRPAPGSLLVRNNQQQALRELDGQQQQMQRVFPRANTNQQQQSQFQSSSVVKNNGYLSNNSNDLQACGPVQQRQLFRPPVAANNHSAVGQRNENLLSSAALQQQQQQIGNTNDIDLIDCNTIFDDDLDAFEGFKCDPKLIKSSSIETLCGINGTGGDDDDVELDLANFKSNTELIMSQLQSCWQHPAGKENKHHQDILSPIQANLMLANYNCSTANLQSSNDNNQQQSRPMMMNDDTLGKASFNSNNNNGTNSESSFPAADRQPDCGFEMHLKKKHDLDELTTNLLAELTASLKAQVDMKNKRSGLAGCFTQELTHTSESNDNNQTSSAPNQQQVVATSGDGINPIELVNEFDSLKPTTNGNGR